MSIVKPPCHLHCPHYYPAMSLTFFVALCIDIFNTSPHPIDMFTTFQSWHVDHFYTLDWHVQYFFLNHQNLQHFTTTTNPAFSSQPFNTENNQNTSLLLLNTALMPYENSLKVCSFSMWHSQILATWSFSSNLVIVPWIGEKLSMGAEFQQFSRNNNYVRVHGKMSEIHCKVPLFSNPGDNIHFLVKVRDRFVPLFFTF